MDENGSDGGDRCSDFGSELTDHLIMVSEGLRGIKDDPNVFGLKAVY